MIQGPVGRAARFIAMLLAALASACAGPDVKESDAQVAAERFFRVGHGYLVSGDLDQAELWLKKAEEKKPDNADLQNLLGLLYWSRGKRAPSPAGGKPYYENAVRHFEAALKLSPKFTKVENNLAVCLADLGRDEEAMKHFAAVLADPQYPTPEKVHNNLAILQTRQGRFEDAIESYKKAITLEPDFYLGYMNLGKVYLRTGQNEEAKQAFSNAIRLKSDLPEAHYNMGLLYLREGLGEPAKAAFEEVLRSSDKQSPLYIEAERNLAALGGRAPR